MSDRTAKYRKIFGETVRAERLSRQMTQEQFAEKADLSLNFIGNIERGEQAASFDSILQIAGGLKMTVEQLMGKAKL